MGSPAAPLSFRLAAECAVSRARAAVMTLPHSAVDTPVFMPVGTQGSLKGLLPDQLEALDCHIILANTYHLGNRPGADLLKRVGGLHKFMGWSRGLLTDSGGFQMVSLLKLSQLTEEGVKFQSPYDGSELMLSPEKSIEIQNSIGADIMMQLDDVVHTLTTGARVEEAMLRTVRWLDRCLKANRREEEQSIFPIVQGGLDADLRRQCARLLVERKVNGYAIGGLSGGEAKDDFWKVVKLCTEMLPKDKPRYCMGVGFATDLVVCVALGVDMFDCVFPTRTARFGCGLVKTGQINLKLKRYMLDVGPIEEGCDCSTCKRYSRAYIHTIVTIETVACHLLTVHNLHYQLKLMRDMRQAIIDQTFPEFVNSFMFDMYKGKEVPTWIQEALASVGIDLSKTCSKTDSGLRPDP